MPIYDKKLSLQVSSRMLGRLHDIAEHEDLSLSELTRWAIRTGTCQRQWDTLRD